MGFDAHVYGGPVGPPATIVRKLRQVRKEATVANDSGAGVWLAGLPPLWLPVLSATATAWRMVGVRFA